MDQEKVRRVFAEHGPGGDPVVDGTGACGASVTVDDIVDDGPGGGDRGHQKIGGTRALDAPYLEVGLLEWCASAAGG